jgi:hydroxymethylpyrimidine/phosphomethylpyrimidine kinase
MPDKSLLTIAGTDPSGGAGIQVDLQVFRDWGYHGLSAITAVVTQDTTGVFSFDPCRRALLRNQIDAITADVPISGIKIGMLPTLGSVEAIVAFLEEFEADHSVPIVVDTVLTSGKGDVEMARLGAAEAILDQLIGHADIVTPNVPELERLTGNDITTRAEAEDASKELLESGCDAVLFKTGHMERDTGSENVQDLLVIADGEATWLEPLARVDADVHGTGCQLSSAICAALADGMGMLDAAEASRRYLNDLLHARVRHIGRGRPVIVRTESPRN